ncbi:Nucleolar protein 56 [Fasciola gigantica]|uniref:Nucleolar protein 56 n=1 Tax=Fasciola gigantica TaxID=46835 RepID=A0A504Z954_FASGI|nr:Nucleolar protein 56 [Fasciola gigantica]
MKHFILYEHALGFALLRVKTHSVESLVELALSLLDNNEAFCKAFNLHAFSPFGSSANALQNCNAISEGVIGDDLKTFLMEQLPLASHVLLCVAERKLAEALKAPETGFPDSLVCSSESVLSEVFRAVRLHFPTFIKDLSHFNESKAQIGLGHSYSRAKVKFNVNRNDNMIIQSINLLDQLDKDVNTFCMRVKEWFCYHFPELIKIVPDNVTFVKVIGLIGTREGAVEEKLEALEELTDGTRARAILDAASASFGFDISEDDATNLSEFTERIIALIERRKHLQNYLASKLNGVAPNLSTLLGDRVSARLISHAGSLTNLAKFPASTIQILGAEKALFRALRHRGRTPKYGLIYHSPFITRAARQNKGRVSRFLAAKCAIACRLDCFSEVLNDIYGRHLRKQVEDRLKFFETGQPAPTNAEAMALANSEAHKFIRKMKKKAIRTLHQRASPFHVSFTTTIDGETRGEAKLTNDKEKENGNQMVNQGALDPIDQQQQECQCDENVSVHVKGLLKDSEKKQKKRKRNQSESVNNITQLDGSLTPIKTRKRMMSESGLLGNQRQQSPGVQSGSRTPHKKRKRKVVEPV